MNPRREAAFTWLELLVCLSIAGILIALALPSITVGPTRPGQMTQSLSNMKQLLMATQQMVLDGETTANTNLGWPGETGGTFTNWARQLVPAYLSTNDFCKLLSAAGKIVPRDKMPESMSNSAVLVYAVSNKSPSDTVLFSSANFIHSPSGSSALNATNKPFGNKGFVIFHKGGDGAILLPKQVRATNIIGAYAPLCR